MADTPRHTYQVLTKRSRRLAQVADKLEWSPNIWIGVSVETDRYAFRVDHVREVDAAVRFISAEPLLGPVPSLNLSEVHWVIAGGESGTAARPMHPAWARQLRDACREADVPFFFKQWGTWAPAPPEATLSVTVEGDLVRSDRLVGVPGAPAPVRRSSKAPPAVSSTDVPGTRCLRGPDALVDLTVSTPREWHAWSVWKTKVLIGAYLPAFTTACKGVAHRSFIDCFAGEPDAVDWERKTLSGSARLALMADPRLTHAVFFELAEIAVPLETALRTEFPDRDLHVIGGDCNERITEGLDWLRSQGTATSGPQLGRCSPYSTQTPCNLTGPPSRPSQNGLARPHRATTHAGGWSSCSSCFQREVPAVHAYPTRNS